MKAIRPSATLFCYDGPQVLEARDAIGGHCVCLLIEDSVDGERFLVAGVEPERLREFRIGTLDLRTLLLERAEDVWYLAKPGPDAQAPLVLEPQMSAVSAFPHLPEPGFVLHDRSAVVETVREARARNNLASISTVLEMANTRG